MLKPAVAVVAMLLGGAAAGVAIHVQNRPEAFTSRKPWLDTGIQPVKREMRGAIASIDVKPMVFAIDEITVGSGAVRVPSAGSPEPATRPCSDWWEIGPQSNVRMLCP